MSAQRHGMRSRRWCAWALLGTLASIPGCSLGDVEQDDCATDADCRQAFGFGSRCVEGFCSDVELPLACDMFEPPSLGEEIAQGAVGERIVFGVVLETRTEKEAARAAAVALGIEEINEVAGGIGGRKLGAVFCNNDVDGSSANDEEESVALLDSLGGQLGLPLIIGPSTSAAALAMTNGAVQNRYDTVILSPSATGVSLTAIADRLEPDDPHGLFWRTCPSDRFQARRMVQLLGDEGVSDVGVAFQQDSYGTGLRDALASEAESALTFQTYPYEVASEPALTDNIRSAVELAADGGHDAFVFVASDAGRTRTAMEAAVGTALDAVPWFLTDGSKDAALLLAEASPEVEAILASTKGTAPANPTSGVFFDSLKAEGFDPTAFSFVAHAYDAGYVGAYAAAFAASRAGPITGRSMAEGMSMLASGTALGVGPTDFPEAVQLLRSGDGFDLEGASGPLDFDASTGQAPGKIEVWAPNAELDGFERLGEPVVP